jgi:hypothetical protein
VAAVGAVLAFGATGCAVILQGRSLRDERAERKKLEARQDAAEAERLLLQLSEQARKVGGYLLGGGADRVSITLVNASQLVVSQVEAVAIADHFYADGRPFTLALFGVLLDQVIVLEPGVLMPAGTAYLSVACGPGH